MMNIDVKRAMLEFSFSRPITIEGIGLGSGVRDIPYEVVTSYSPNTSPELVERNGEFIRTLKDGSENTFIEQGMLSTGYRAQVVCFQNTSPGK